MKDKAIPLNWMHTDHEYVLDGKTYSSISAIHYLKEQGFPAIEALKFMKSLREAAINEHAKK
jgi:hypothetical protein